MGVVTPHDEEKAIGKDFRRKGRNEGDEKAGVKDDISFVAS